MPNMLNLDNTLIVNNAYRIAPKTDLQINDVYLDPSWFNNFAHELNCKAYLNTHVGMNSTYSGRKALKESLSVIYIYYHGLNKHMISADEQAAIKDKILEGVELCTPGFHNRINQIIMGFQTPNSIDALMMRHRTEIVTKLANAHINDDVHEHNEYFLIANKMGKNVYAINDNDPHLLIVDKDAVRQKITAAFSQHYHPWAIIQNTITEYKNILINHHNYTGIKAAGYGNGDYEEWCVYLAKLLDLLDEDISLADFLIMDEETVVVTDINWSYITEKFAEALINKGYFNLTALQQDSMLKLTQIDADFTGFNINSALDLIPNDDILLNILTYLSKTNVSLSAELYNSYVLRHRLNNIEKQALNNAIFKNISLQPLLSILMVKHQEIFINELQRRDGNNNPLQQALIYKNATLVQCYMQVMACLNYYERNNIFDSQDSQGNNTLMQAVKSASWAVNDLLAELIKSPFLLDNILQHKNHLGENTMTIALKNNDKASIKSLLKHSAQLDYATRFAILSKVNPSVIARHKEAGNLIQIAQLLLRLEAKTHELEYADNADEIKISNHVQKLYRNLSEHYLNYINNEDNPETRMKLAKNWQDEIKNAKHSPIIEHRGYKEIATILLLCLSVIGLLVIALKAATHYAKEGNMRFFNVTKTDTEMCLDALDDKVTNISSVGA